MSQTRVVKELIQMATARLLGRTTAGAGIAEEISVGAGLTLSAGSLAGSAASDTAAGIVELATSAETVTGTSTSLAVTPAGFRAANIVLGTAVNSTSGISIDFTGIPSWAKRVTINFSGVSTNGTSGYLVRIGSGSFLATGYNSGASLTTGGTVAGSNDTTGFILSGGSVSAATTFHGSLVLNNISGNNWVSAHSLGLSNAAGGMFGGGSVSLSGALDRVRITTVGGTDTFDAGTINVSWE